MNNNYEQMKVDKKLTKYFGALPRNFTACVWGQSSNGKSDFALQLANMLYDFGKVLYMSLEMSHNLSLQIALKRHHISSKNILFSNHEFLYPDLINYLEKKNSAQFIIVDSLDYLGIDYTQYKQLKTLFPQKSFTFLCHSRYQYPASRTADRIRYDAEIKIRVEGFVAFIKSRYGGNKNYLIWREGALKYWGEKLKDVL